MDVRNFNVTHVSHFVKAEQLLFFSKKVPYKCVSPNYVIFQFRIRFQFRIMFHRIMLYKCVSPKKKKKFFSTMMNKKG